jgi:hypothetical protein
VIPILGHFFSGVGPKGRACFPVVCRCHVSPSYLGSEMEEAAQNCLPSIQASTSRFACSSEIPERVLTIEQS